MSVAPAPWVCRLDAVVWWHRARPGAAPHAGGFPSLALTGAALVRYHETPVGPYEEILASPVVLLDPLPAASIPFIAVDSEASVRGGRANWALPKVLARFEQGLRADGDGWSLRAAVRARPRAVPVRAAFAARQRFADGSAPRIPVVLRAGRVRLASVAVQADGLPWAAPGRHPGLVLEGARVRVGAPRR